MPSHCWHKRVRAGGWLLLLALVSTPSLPVGAADERPVRVVRYPDMSSEKDRRNAYFVDLLALALEKTRESHGDYRLEPVPLRVPQGRILRMLSAGEAVDVMWTMTSRERERNLRPVRIPLIKGLGGYRALVIRREDRKRFARIRSRKALAEKVAGQGADWPDTDILRDNELPVTTSGYFSLFTMLKHGRIDYIPRALNEPWVEVRQRPELELAVESSLLLHYPTANYFFVRKGNRFLAERLKQGLELAMADGSFDRHFYHHPTQEAVFERAQVRERRLLTLDNPLLPPDTPLEREALWWRPEQARPEAGEP